MRLKRLILWDMKFQMKYGFYLLYSLLTALYLAALFAIPNAWKENVAAILIFSDPAAMGLFFMGAIVLLEKSQKMPCALAVSPVSAMEYIISKVVSLCAIELVVAVILAIGAGVEDLSCLLLGTALTGILFTLSGIMIASKITSLNQFLLWTVPIEMLATIPAVLHLFGITPSVFRFYPTSICMDMLTGKPFTFTGIFNVIVLIAGLLVAAQRCVLKMWKSTGGAKL